MFSNSIISPKHVFRSKANHKMKTPPTTKRDGQSFGNLSTNKGHY